MTKSFHDGCDFMTVFAEINEYGFIFAVGQKFLNWGPRSRFEVSVKVQ